MYNFVEKKLKSVDKNAQFKNAVILLYSTFETDENAPVEKEKLEKREKIPSFSSLKILAGLLFRSFDLFGFKLEMILKVLFFIIKR